MFHRGRKSLFEVLPQRQEIIDKFNEEVAKNGGVNKTEFYNTHIAPILPDFKKEAWFKTIRALERNKKVDLPPEKPKTEIVFTPGSALVAPAESTREGIKVALNIGREALEQIRENPHLVPPYTRAKLLFDAMNAQNNRINAIAAIRQDRREEAKFQKTFDAATYTDIDGEETPLEE